MEKFEELIPFPMKIRIGELPKTQWYDSTNTIKVEMLAYPQHDFRKVCYEMIKSTWADQPVWKFKTEDINKVFKKLLSFKVLPNSMEHINFQFRIEGITLVEVTHLLRHRLFHSIHAQCTADRFLQQDSAFIPSSIKGTKYEKRYRELTEDCKQLYTDMINDDVSLFDARYILNRNHRYFYYVGMNLMTFIQFFKQRRCTAIQPELDNIIAMQIYEHVASIIPEIRDVLKLECDKSCAMISGDLEDTTRAYQPDKVHSQLIGKFNPENFIYRKTRKQLRISNHQDK